MDQIHLPDPIKNELELMHEQISHIQKQLNKMSKEQ